MDWDTKAKVLKFNPTFHPQSITYISFRQSLIESNNSRVDQDFMILLLEEIKSTFLSLVNLLPFSTLWSLYSENIFNWVARQVMLTKSSSPSQSIQYFVLLYLLRYVNILTLMEYCFKHKNKLIQIRVIIHNKRFLIFILTKHKSELYFMRKQICMRGHPKRAEFGKYGHTKRAEF